MFEKVNPMHPDKIADRIAGAIVDEAYRLQENPKIAVEVLIGHGTCTIISESSTVMADSTIADIVHRIAGENIEVRYIEVPQDEHLAENQDQQIRCGDNGIFKGMPVTGEQLKMSKIAADLYKTYISDGKYILDGDKLIICQSNADKSDLYKTYIMMQLSIL